MTKEELRYDLALNAAIVMTLRGNIGNPPDMMLSNFLLAYRQYAEERLAKQLDDAVKELNQNGSS